MIKSSVMHVSQDMSVKEVVSCRMADLIDTNAQLRKDNAALQAELRSVKHGRPPQPDAAPAVSAAPPAAAAVEQEAEVQALGPQALQPPVPAASASPEVAPAGTAPPGCAEVRQLSVIESKSLAGCIIASCALPHGNNSAGRRRHSAADALSTLHCDVDLAPIWLMTHLPADAPMVD